MSVTYKDAGVDLELYQQAMQKLPGLMRRTHVPRVLDLPGGFAGLFRLNYHSRQFHRDYRDPVLVSGTDGVGTKIKVAIQAGRFNTIGIDLVGMCVNDCLCLGAEPLFFLDYLALGKDNPELIAELVKGVSDGCLQASSSLLGGETAIMPDLYAEGDFDMAGFSVGVVERSRLVDGRGIRPGDALVGLASTGFHSNGYSLIRKVVFERAGLTCDDHVAELGKSVGDVLLEPTRIYVKPVMEVLSQYRARKIVRGMAHITGGGLAENVERILPEDRRVTIHRSRWSAPPVFEWFERLGGVDRDERFRVFNMGIGFVMVVSPYFADSIQRRLADQGIESWVIGEVSQGERAVDVVD